MRRQYATAHPAAEPRPGPTRMPVPGVADEVPHDQEVGEKPMPAMTPSS